MREKTIEAKLVQTVRSMGGLAPKFTSPGLDGMPDRIVLLPLSRQLPRQKGAGDRSSARRKRYMA